MKKNLKAIFLSMMLALGLPKIGMAAPVICDSMQAVDVKLEVVMDDAVMKQLNDVGIEVLSVTPASSSSWSEEFPVENGTRLTLSDNAGQIALNMQEGLLVTYNVCGSNIVYAYCQMDQDLKGEFPKEVKLHLNPAVEKCKVEVLCTQCP